VAAERGALREGQGASSRTSGAPHQVVDRTADSSTQSTPPRPPLTPNVHGQRRPETAGIELLPTAADTIGAA
jgi:hypothetical protein